MTKSELIERLAKKHSALTLEEIERVVKCMLEQMSRALATGERIEIRGFGSFSLHYHPPRMGRNPKTGESIALISKYAPYFKPGEELRRRVDKSFSLNKQTLPCAKTHDNG
jgi:integration host factor subunit beta